MGRSRFSDSHHLAIVYWGREGKSYWDQTVKKTRSDPTYDEGQSVITTGLG